MADAYFLGFSTPVRFAYLRTARHDQMPSCCLILAGNYPQISHTFSNASRYCSYDMSLVSPPRLRERLRERLRRRRLLRLTGLSLLLLHKGQQPFLHFSGKDDGTASKTSSFV